MTVPFWCLLVGVLLPYVWHTRALAFRKKQFGSLDNKHPRIQAAKLEEGPGSRAQAASANAFEALAVFTPAVLVANVSHANPLWSNALSALWVLFRIGHGFAYIANADKVRSTLFGLASCCAAGLFALATAR